MKKLVEIYMTQYDGAYEQYFYTVENEKKFITETLKYLNTVKVKSEHPMYDVLIDFKGECAVEPYFMLGDSPHLKETYYIDFEYSTGFSMEKRTLKYEKEVIE